MVGFSRSVFLFLLWFQYMKVSSIVGPPLFATFLCLRFLWPHRVRKALHQFFSEYFSDGSCWGREGGTVSPAFLGDWFISILSKKSVWLVDACCLPFPLPHLPFFYPLSSLCFYLRSLHPESCGLSELSSMRLDFLV